MSNIIENSFSFLLTAKLGTILINQTCAENGGGRRGVKHRILADKAVRQVRDFLAGSTSVAD